MAIPTLGAMIAAVGSPAEWGAVATSKLFWDDTNGKLGIGTTHPDYPLEVVGTIGINSNASAGYGVATLVTSEATPYDILTIHSIGKSGGWAGAINFDISRSAGSAFTAMTIRGNTDGTTANVGIGMAAPGAKLEVAASSGTTFKATTTGTTSTDIVFHCYANNANPYAGIFEQADTATAAAQYPLGIRHTLTSGTAAANMLVGVTFHQPDAAGTLRTCGTLGFKWSDAAAATASSTFRITILHSGSSADRFSIKSSGVINMPILATTTYTNNTTAKAGGLVDGDLYRVTGFDYVNVVHS